MRVPMVQYHKEVLRHNKKRRKGNKSLFGDFFAKQKPLDLLYPFQDFQGNHEFSETVIGTRKGLSIVIAFFKYVTGFKKII